MSHDLLGNHMAFVGERKEWPECWLRIEAVLEDARVTDEDYRASREAGADARLERVWFGSGKDLKIRSLDFCCKFLKEAA
ncbi:hypothetical protein [Mesorhizobium sp. LNJC391B00]|uniref:hypothetical protein n=1 Tax=Mesorhizobium sp. LNJC391B00 TaxID=1287273 RepID=UPI0003CF0259|nr:hypothetical protein [Mesorhizobium sp. LNJC391B00]ESY27717.1 hypothetical protein X749_20570 [Mesorhizobium sp. LNJC391B00]